jgi:hypothetical protein
VGREDASCSSPADRITIIMYLVGLKVGVVIANLKIEAKGAQQRHVVPECQKCL